MLSSLSTIFFKVLFLKFKSSSISNLLKKLFNLVGVLSFLIISFNPYALCEHITVVNRVGLHQVSKSRVTRKMKIYELKYIMNKYKNDVSFLDYIKVLRHLLPNWLHKLKQKII